MGCICTFKFQNLNVVLRNSETIRSSGPCLTGKSTQAQWPLEFLFRYGIHSKTVLDFCLHGHDPGEELGLPGKYLT